MKEYAVMIAGQRHTMLLDEEDAKRLGAKAVTTEAAPDVKAQAAPANKARASTTTKYANETVDGEK